MVKNPFLKQREVEQRPNRNTFDLSHTNNLTFQIGKYVPFLCQPVLPGESYELSTAFGLRTPPMVFPIQTRLNARVHYFYVRNKNLWKNWQNFIGKQKDVSMPWIGSYSPELWKVSGLADYLGVPVTYHGQWQTGRQQTMALYGLNELYGIYPESTNQTQYLYYIPNSILTQMNNLESLTPSNSLRSVLSTRDLNSRAYIYGAYTGWTNQMTNKPYNISAYSREMRISTIPNSNNPDANSPFIYVVYLDGADASLNGNNFLAYRKIFANYTGKADEFTVNVNNFDFNAQGNSNEVGYVSELVLCTGISEYTFTEKLESGNLSAVLVVESRIPSESELSEYSIPWSFSQLLTGSEVTEVNRLPVNPYVIQSLESGRRIENIRINALPFRAYESIYNGFYRDTRNNPLIVDGEPEYNKFITTDDDGKDLTDYHLFNANYEADYLTTATQTPQQGIAPLIGVTGTGLMSFQASDGSTIYAQARLDDDGNTVIGLDGYDEKLPDGSLQILQDTISAGISINDLRNVNALQRWLERNLRLGFRYKELVKAQFGVDIDWSELDMPEFIGGTSKTINISQVTQTTPGSGGLQDSLGSIAGQGGLVGESKPIRHYCDDYGYIIGIISVVPVPVYSQTLPKHFLCKSPLDYFSPDFAFIGAQPILNKEVAPLQSYMASLLDASAGGEIDYQNKVFGYQRAWYDYIQNFDTAHGLFRTSLRNFVYHRVFDNVPELGEEFLTVDASQFNNVFQVTEDTDKIYGEIYIHCSAKRPIPEVIIPKLEA